MYTGYLGSCLLGDLDWGIFGHMISVMWYTITRWCFIPWHYCKGICAPSCLKSLVTHVATLSSWHQIRYRSCGSLTLCEGNPWITGGPPHKSPVLRKALLCHGVSHWDGFFSIAIWFMIMFTLNLLTNQCMLLCFYLCFPWPLLTEMD